MQLIGRCFRRAPDAPEAGAGPPPASPPPPDTAAAEALDARVRAIEKSLEDMVAAMVTRADLAAMAGVEEQALGDTRLRTGGAGWRFLSVEQSAEKMDRVPLD